MINSLVFAIRACATTAMFAAFSASLALPAFADATAAQSCAATLSPESQAIYAATAPHVTKAVPFRDALKSQTRKLVMAGQVKRGEAKASAIAAANCLKMLQD